MLYVSFCLSGMAYLEELKIIHKDLAARNVMLTEFKRAKVGDFGLSKPDVDEDGSDQFPLNWSAPEVVIKRKPVLKSDVWSFGKILIYMRISGRKVFFLFKMTFIVSSCILPNNSY